MTGRFQSQASAWVTCGILLISLFLTGCAQDQEQRGLVINQEESATGSGCGNIPKIKATPSPGQLESDEPLDTSLLPEPVVAIPASKSRPTQECYHLQPSVSQGKKKKGGRCEPQSLPFARCRSGINSCCLGWNNGPLTWFACEQQHNNTSLIPRGNSVLILAANKRNNMPTGHVAYVEEVIAEKAPNYKLIFSHTNYDRRCSLETGIEADYNSSTKTLNILTGAWKGWGKGLPVSGFILR